MSNYPEALDHMLAAWNESDSAKVRGHLERALAPNVRFVDPSIDLTGLDEFEANVHDVHERLPGAVYSRTSSVDSHHQLYRYNWAIHVSGKLVLPGFDVVEIDDTGRVSDVLGFFGPLAPREG